MKAEIYGLGIDESNRLSVMLQRYFSIEAFNILVYVPKLHSVKNLEEFKQNASVLILRGISEENNAKNIRKIAKAFPNTTIFFSDTLVS